MHATHTHRDNTQPYDHAHEPRSSTTQDYKPTQKKSQPKRPNKHNDRQRVFYTKSGFPKFLKPTNRHQNKLPTSPNQSHTSPDTTPPTNRDFQVNQPGSPSSPHRFKRGNKDKGGHSHVQHANSSNRPMKTQRNSEKPKIAILTQIISPSSSSTMSNPTCNRSAMSEI
jgi:hypothetical protein